MCRASSACSCFLLWWPAGRNDSLLRGGVFSPRAEIPRPCRETENKYGLHNGRKREAEAESPQKAQASSRARRDSFAGASCEPAQALRCGAGGHAASDVTGQIAGRTVAFGPLPEAFLT